MVDRPLGLEAHGLAQGVDGRPVGAFFIVDPPERVLHRRHVARLLAGRLGQFQRLVEVLPAVGQKPGQVVGRHRRVGVDLERLAVVALGLLPVLLRLVDRGQQDMGLDIFRVDLEGVVELPDRPVGRLLGHEQLPQQPVGGQVVPVDVERLAEGRFRLRVILP